MAYKNNNSLQFLILALIVCRQLVGQQPPNLEPILQRSESYQRQFVADFLQKGDATGTIAGYPDDTPHNQNFWLLSKDKEWVLPMVESHLKTWMEDPELNATIGAFDVIARVFKNRPDLGKWEYRVGIPGRNTGSA